MLYERTGLSTNKDVVLKNSINGKDLNQMRFLDDCMEDFNVSYLVAIFVRR